MKRRRRPVKDDRRFDGPRVNERIRVPRVLVVDERGNKLGEFLTPDAVNLARERGLDLVEVAPTAKPPVCRVADWGRMKYERKKRSAEARKKQVQIKIKELKVRPKTDDHDIDVKTKLARKFLVGGDKVRITVWFRGREHAHHEIGAQQCMRIFEGCKDVAVVEVPPAMEGRRMTMLMGPSETGTTP